MKLPNPVSDGRNPDPNDVSPQAPPIPKGFWDSWTVKDAIGQNVPLGKKPRITEDDARQAVAAANGNKSAAARRLGITRNKLRYLLGEQ